MDCPISVNEILRVVRVRSFIPRRDSRVRMVWLRADCETPKCAAALVKLFSRATTINAIKSLRFSRANLLPLLPKESDGVV